MDDEMYCAAVNCKSKVGEAPGKTFHSFPIWNPALLEKWTKKLRCILYWKPTCTSVLCSDHFEEKCFDTIGDVKHIRADAVPTIFSTNRKPKKTMKVFEKPQITSVISLDNLITSSVSKDTSQADPLELFHQKIEEVNKLKKEAKRKKAMLRLILSLKCSAINQQKIKVVLNRSRLLKRKPQY